MNFNVNEERKITQQTFGKYANPNMEYICPLLLYTAATMFM
jgi:hypothetical protein